MATPTAFVSRKAYTRKHLYLASLILNKVILQLKLSKLNSIKRKNYETEAKLFQNKNISLLFI